MRFAEYCLCLSAAAAAHAGEGIAPRFMEDPAIMIVIDDSRSMLLNDPEHARFKALGPMLDSIRAAAPSARVGAVVFSDRLAFDHRDNPFFAPLFPGDSAQNDAYIPLTPLDTAFGEGLGTGLDTLKALLSIRGDGSLAHRSSRPKERIPRDGGSGTDITLGFDAARRALAAAPQPKDSRYILFLSDGAANVSDALRIDRESAYEIGYDTPTTFTVCFDPESKRPAETLMRMTGNIRRNRYSTSNPLSAAFGVQRPAAELQGLLEKRVLAKILADQWRAAADLRYRITQASGGM